MTMIEELVQQFETELMTDETDVQETTEQATMDNVDETNIQETDEQQAKPVSLVASIVEQLEREMMTDETEDDEQDVPADESESDQLDESEPTDDEEESESSEPADESEPSDDETDEPNESDDERKEWQRKVEEAEQRASESERKARQLTMSYLLQTRDDVTDIRLVASLIGDVNKIEMDAGESLEEAISRKIDETIKRYPTLVKDGKKEYRTITTNEGISVQSEIRPIGKPTAKAQDEPFNSKAELLEEARERAEKGGQKERVNYLALKRKYGLK